MKDKEKNKGTGLRWIFFFGILSIILILLGIDVIININRKIVQTTNITKTEKEVTITDQGIAEAVDKLYDATVIVELLQGNSVIGWGSGFVYKVDGNDAYVITNYHVTDGYKNVQIEYTDGTTTNGDVIGGDEYTDVSVIKVNAGTIKKVAELGDSTKTQLGDTVFTIGTPISMKFKFSVTRGILSGKNRIISMANKNKTESWYISLLQMDAPINSGNSGGPLANANGEVIGINNSKLSSAEIENISFSVPIEDVKNVAEQVISKGSVERPYLGVGLTTVEAAKMQGIISEDVNTQGAVIGSVENNSALGKAGIKVGDIITKFGDYDIQDYKYLRYYLFRYKVGDKVSFTYVRDGKEHKGEVTLQKK